MKKTWKINTQKKKKKKKNTKELHSLMIAYIYGQQQKENFTNKYEDTNMV